MGHIKPKRAERFECQNGGQYEVVLWGSLAKIARASGKRDFDASLPAYSITRNGILGGLKLNHDGSVHLVQIIQPFTSLPSLLSLPSTVS